MNKQPYQLLEEKYAKFTGSKFGVSCNSGTSALHLGLLALGIGQGDEVIMPDFTMAACGFSVSYCGAKPIFVDCDDTLCIDSKLIEAKITKKTKAIMAVHIYGRLCQMDKILKIAKKHHLKVIEDACEAQGAVYKSKADITCYSFYENKIIHAEEGGMCTTDNKKYAEKINYYKNMCFTPEHNYMHNHIGYNYRMPNSQAKLAIESLNNYPQENKRRRKVERKFDSFFKEAKLIKMPKRDAVWVYDYFHTAITGIFGYTPKGYTENGKEILIEIRPFFKPLSTFPMYGGKCQSPKALHYSKIGHYIKL